MMLRPVITTNPPSVRLSSLFGGMDSLLPRDSHPSRSTRIVGTITFFHVIVANDPKQLCIHQPKLLSLSSLTSQTFRRAAKPAPLDTAGSSTWAETISPADSRCFCMFLAFLHAPRYTCAPRIISGWHARDRYMITPHGLLEPEDLGIARQCMTRRKVYLLGCPCQTIVLSNVVECSPYFACDCARVSCCYHAFILWSKVWPSRSTGGSPSTAASRGKGCAAGSGRWLLQFRTWQAELFGSFSGLAT